MTSEFAPDTTLRASPVDPALLSLGPLEVPNMRLVRYVGDDLNIALGDLAPNDEAAMRTAYWALRDMLDRIARPGGTDAESWDSLQQWCAQEVGGLQTVFSAINQLGRDTMARDGQGEMLAKVLHDVRGGGLTALLGRLQLLDWLSKDGEGLRMIFVLTRDHLKIMRNAVTGLDDPRREADRVQKSHAIHLILEKWHKSIVGPYPSRRGKPLHMHVESHYEGALTECCLESAAIDRIFYNLAANACRHCAPEGRLEMSIFPLPTEKNLRFVLSNPVNLEDTATLCALGEPARDGDKAGIYLDSLFSPKVSSTGSGYGLTVVADFVAGAYGLRDKDAAVAERYVGARLDGDIFRVFFHWPAASNAFPQKLDDPHRPEVSLAGK